MATTGLKMGAESKDPEDFYCTKTASGSSTDPLSRKPYSVFMPDTAWLRLAAAPVGRGTMVAPGVSPGSAVKKKRSPSGAAQEFNRLSSRDGPRARTALAVAGVVS